MLFQSYYKIKFILKFTIKKYCKIVDTVFMLLGTILMIGECIQWMFDSNIIYIWMHEYVVLILLTCMLVSALKNRVKLSYDCFLKNSDVKIGLKVNDILNEKSAIIIPTNTTFDTKMEDEFISIGSVQGQFQKKYFDNNLGALDNLIENGLKGYSYEIIDRINSKNKKYPIGTVSKVTYNKKHYYFVAIADINEFGKTVDAKFENIHIALEGLWNYLESKGHVENLAIPLLGTGRAGIKDASRSKVIREIIFSFVASTHKRKVTENLQICIHPLDLERKDLELENLKEYLYYICKYDM